MNSLIIWLLLFFWTETEKKGTRLRLQQTKKPTINKELCGVSLAAELMKCNTQGTIWTLQKYKQ